MVICTNIDPETTPNIGLCRQLFECKNFCTVSCGFFHQVGVPLPSAPEALLRWRGQRLAWGGRSSPLEQFFAQTSTRPSEPRAPSGTVSGYLDVSWDCLKRPDQKAESRNQAAHELRVWPDCNNSG